MNKYTRDFINEEEAIETIEFVGMLAVAAMMIAAISRIASKMKGKMQGLANTI